MDLGIKGKVALVAAASRGLGYAVARELAQEGCTLVICARNADGIQKAAETLRATTGAEVVALAADVSDGEQIQQLVETANHQFGGVDLLFANAGGPPPGAFVQLSDDQWLNAVNLNLMSVVRLCRGVLPHMQQQQWGRIVIDTSFTVKQPLENLILSNAIRAGVLGMAKTLSNEIAKENITVNCICPGYIQTERFVSLMDNRAKQGQTTREAVISTVATTIPMARIGTVDEFAAAAAFLLSARASYITGVALQVDGGAVKGLF